MTAAAPWADKHSRFTLTFEDFVFQLLQHCASTQAYRCRATYAKRKCTIEPVFGIIRSILGHWEFFRQAVRNAEAERSLIGLEPEANACLGEATSKKS